MRSLQHLRALGPFPPARAGRAGADIAHLMAHPTADPVLSLDQAVAYSGGIAAKTLRADIAAGKLVATRRSADGTVRVRLSDLHRYLDSQRRDYTPAPARAERSRDWGL